MQRSTKDPVQSSADWGAYLSGGAQSNAHAGSQRYGVEVGVLLGVLLAVGVDDAPREPVRLAVTECVGVTLTVGVGD